MDFTVKNFLWLDTNPDIVVKVQFTMTVYKEIIKQNCEFKLYYNKTDVTPTVLDM